MNYDDVHSVMVLYAGGEDEKNMQVENIKKELVNDKKQVTLCGFVDKKKSDSRKLLDSYLIDTSQLGIFGEPKKSEISNLLDKDFDLVLDLTLTDILPLQYVLAYAKAPFKAGLKTEEHRLLDFMIDVAYNEDSPLLDEDYLFKQIIFYLKSIKSNN